jgi:transcription termination/antitermination protein NusA
MCTNALNPADILDISVDEANGVILVVVPHDQLSLAIGKRGQNARLASKLMGWNIDIKSDVELTGEGSTENEPEKVQTAEKSEVPIAQVAKPDVVEAKNHSGEPVTTVEGASEVDGGSRDSASDTETRGED